MGKSQVKMIGIFVWVRLSIKILKAQLEKLLIYSPLFCSITRSPDLSPKHLEELFTKIAWSTFTHWFVEELVLAHGTLLLGDHESLQRAKAWNERD